MNINKFTQKSVQAVQDCEKIAYDYGHQELAQEHLLYALMTDGEGLIPKLLTKMDIVPEVFTAQIEGLLEKRVKVSGAAQVYVGNDLNKVLIYAEDEAKAMNDAYVSVEHLFLSLLKQPSKEVKELFRSFGITRERFLQALATVRGNQQVVTDNPEATYDTLQKYGPRPGGQPLQDPGRVRQRSHRRRPGGTAGPGNRP